MSKLYAYRPCIFIRYIWTNYIHTIYILLLRVLIKDTTNNRVMHIQGKLDVNMPKGRDIRSI